MTDTAIIDALWRLAGEPKSNWNYTFDPVGLILLDPIGEVPYPPFPQNVAAFATTGGDSVHYGLLDVGSGYGDCSPVVMTVPCAEKHNFVVGADLRDFLCLGCRTGYFSLEQLAYDWTASCNHLDKAASETISNTQMAELLVPIQHELQLMPWHQSHNEKLTRLQDKYGNFIRSPPYE